jgi:hypothetical protein
VPVLDSVGIFITSLEFGLTWTTASDQSQFLNWPDGRHPQAGYKGIGLVAHMSKNHRNEQLPETAAMATARVLTAMFSARSNEWSESWENACIAAY